MHAKLINYVCLYVGCAYKRFNDININIKVSERERAIGCLKINIDNICVHWYDNKLFTI